MADRFLVLGDNHGDTASLRRVLADAEDEPVDYVVHVGDVTRAWREARRRDDESAGIERGVEQLRAVEPLLERLDDRATHGLVWVPGNQDYFGDLPYDIDAGTEIPATGHVTVGGQRFTSSPYDAASTDVLVTHMEKWSVVDHFDGRAHFCGNSHRGRHYDRRLNAAFLHYLHPETGDSVYGGYFLVELDGDGGLDVEPRSVGDLERRACDRHRERGIQFQPAERPCMYCRDERTLFRELSASAYYGLTREPDRDRYPRLADSGEGTSAEEGTDRDESSPETVTADALCDYAVDLRDDPPADFRETFEDYLADVDADRYAPLTRTDDGRLTLAAKSYAY